MLSRLSDALVETLLPAGCAHCGEPLPGRAATALCWSCLTDRRRAWGCPLCGALACAGCPLCDRGNGIELTRALWSYEGPARTQLLGAKLGRDPMAPIAAELALALTGWGWTRETVVPIPSHPAAVLARGFAPAVVLARAVGQPLRALRRGWSGPRAAKRLGREERVATLGDLTVRCPRAVRGRSILLIDDVVTTGGTLERAAAVLRQAGARRIRAAVWAATPGKAR